MLHTFAAIFVLAALVACNGGAASPSPATAAVATATAAPTATSAAVPTTAPPSSTAAPSIPPSATASAGSSATPTTTAVPTVAPTGTPVQPATSGAPIPVLGTENFYADLLAQIGGSRVAATSILNDPNADPHEFEASPATAKAVADAKLVIVNGIGYDDWMQKLLAASPRADRSVITVQTVLGLTGDVNAHIWYGPLTMPAVASFVTDALIKMEPQNADYFLARKAQYVAALTAINNKVIALRAKYAGTPVAFTEPVAGYQAEAIGLKVLTPETFQHAIEQGVDPAPGDVAIERDLLTGRKVKVLMYNSQVTSPVTKSIYDLAVQYGIPVVGVAETIPPQYASFQDWQLAQLNALEAALAKGG